MDKDTTNDLETALETAQMPNMDFVGMIEMFKKLYLDWLRFFRDSMDGEWENPGACLLPDDCHEIERVWVLWIETLSEVQRSVLI